MLPTTIRSPACPRSSRNLSAPKWNVFPYVHLSVNRRERYPLSSQRECFLITSQDPYTKYCSQSRPAIRSFAVSRKVQSSRSFSAPIYNAPQNGILSLLPPSWVPYAELIRLDKPAGTAYLFFPCLFSTLLAAIHNPEVSLSAIAGTSTLFVAGAFIMRGAGCTINDLWDRNLDPLVKRTALRPLARRAITPQAAIVFTGIQLLGGLALLLQFPFSCLFYGIPSLALVATYPLAKRITHYPQVVLGLTFSWGAIMGFPALGISLASDVIATKAAALLYASCVSWTVLYDMIYAHMDVRDDKGAGIKSIALRHEADTKTVLSGLGILQVGLLAAAGSMLGAGPAFFLLGCGSAAVTLGTMIWKVNLKSVPNCWWWFRWGVWFTGGGISSGMLIEYLSARLDIEGLKSENEETVASGEMVLHS